MNDKFSYFKLCEFEIKWKLNYGTYLNLCEKHDMTMAVHVKHRKKCEINVFCFIHLLKVVVCKKYIKTKVS